ncbi:hypothetical protein CSOJ01_00258 [Colletotrichum sojae]|uniref:Uncharacterized protein n=1 Tax=Colletotrichum sojae TaxID=2175907 RepID=A0A8H6N5L7_9PEZI|nr:hypothetical protein CSOJ01_00258 [Colletotrichum sojae]
MCSSPPSVRPPGDGTWLVERRRAEGAPSVGDGSPAPLILPSSVPGPGPSRQNTCGHSRHQSSRLESATQAWAEHEPTPIGSPRHADCRSSCLSRTRRATPRMSLPSPMSQPIQQLAFTRRGPEEAACPVDSQHDEITGTNAEPAP